MRQNKKDQGIGDVVSNLGFAFEVFKVIAHAVLAKGGTMQHLRRIVKETSLQKQIAELIVPAGSATEKPLGEGEYLIPVTYTLPSKADLEKEYGKGNVSDLFDGRPFQKHASCEGMDETPGDKVFLVKHFGRETESEANIAEMDKLGYRPATHLEAYAFAKAQPELQRQFWIVALGSFAVLVDDRYVAMLRSVSSGRIFGLSWFVSRWNSDYRFLFVRK